jgi:D-3-phosphoglycerate dehydrogenase / 2-oxoglutarate reductase
MNSGGRILVTPRSLTQAGLDAVAELEPLRRRNFTLVGVTAGRIPTEEELLALVPGCVGWLAGLERITARVLRKATALRVISRNGTGTDGIDLDAAERAGVRICRAAGANAQGVAELALTLLLCALRHVPWTSEALRHGEWQRRPGSEIADRTIGVVGLGAVGRRAAALFGVLGARVVAYDPFLTDSPVRLVDLDELVATCDVISLHCPPPAGGTPLLDADRLARIPPDSVLVNTARSALVDDQAVLAALEDGRLRAYAVDAFETEPPELTPLLRHDRVIATPHLGGYTHASVRRATSMAVQNLVAVLEEDAR